MRKEYAEVTEAIGYVRVSTVEQADSGLSLEAQRRRIAAYAEANGWNLVATYEDAGQSAKTIQRAGLKQALSALSPGRVLLVLKLDRLTRSVKDIYALTELIEGVGAEWAAVQEKFDTSTATGRLMLNLIVQLSQWEREVIGERTSSALKEKRQRGERLGTTPLGFRTEGGQVVQDPDEQETVGLARQMRAEGVTLEGIANRLTAEGRKTKRGGKWHAQTVKLLLSSRYIEGI